MVSATLFDMHFERFRTFQLIEGYIYFNSIYSSTFTDYIYAPVLPMYMYCRVTVPDTMILQKSPAQEQNLYSSAPPSGG